MAFAAINEQRVYFDDTGGDGPAVVLSSRSMTASFLANLAA